LKDGGGGGGGGSRPSTGTGCIAAVSQSKSEVKLSSPVWTQPVRHLLVIHTVTSSLKGTGLLTVLHDRIGLIVTLISA